MIYLVDPQDIFGGLCKKLVCTTLCLTLCKIDNPVPLYGVPD
jgi:hypothetical protein